MINSWQRRGVLPDAAGRLHATQANPDEVISPAGHAGVGPVGEARSRGAGARDHVAAVLGRRRLRPRDRNANGLTTAGDGGAARGDAARAWSWTWTTCPRSAPPTPTRSRPRRSRRREVPARLRPQRRAQDGAATRRRRLPSPTDVPAGAERRSQHTWPSESMKSETQLDYIQDDRGHVRARDRRRRLAGLRQPALVPNDCPGAARPSPRACSTSPHGSTRRSGSAPTGTPCWQARARGSGRWPATGSPASSIPDDMLGGRRPRQAPDRRGRAGQARRLRRPHRQLAPVPVRRAKRPVSIEHRPYAGEGRWLWQAKALVESGVDLTRAGRGRRVLGRRASMPCAGAATSRSG